MNCKKIIKYSPLCGIAYPEKEDYFTARCYFPAKDFIMSV